MSASRVGCSPGCLEDARRASPERAGAGGPGLVHDHGPGHRGARARGPLSSATVRRRIRRVFKGHGPGDCGSVVSLTPLVLSKLSSGRTDGRMDGGAARVPPSSLPGASCSPHPGGNRRSGFVRSESVSRPRGGAQSPSHALTSEGAQGPLPACLPGRLFQE